MNNGGFGPVGEADMIEGGEERTVQICCLIDDKRKCLRPAGNAGYGKKIQKTVQQRKLKLELDEQVQHTYICDFHKEQIQSVRQIKPRKRHGSDNESSPEVERLRKPELNFIQMPVNTLRRYKRHFKLQTRPGLNKTQLAEAVMRHFLSIDVNEKETLAFFMYAAKHGRSKSDHDVIESPMSSPKPIKFHDQ